MYVSFTPDLTSVQTEVGGKGGGASGSGLSGHEHVVSSRWARDEDINRMIRSGKPVIRSGQDSLYHVLKVI